jgi:hypothetical protein
VPVFPTQACRKPLAAEASKPPHVTSANVHMRAAAEGMAHTAAAVQVQRTQRHIWLALQQRVVGAAGLVELAMNASITAQ